jgi:hypothetical protein
MTRRPEIGGVMSTSTIPALPASAPVPDGWRELARREANGLDIALIWNGQDSRVRVTVDDRRVGESFHFDVPGTDALAAYHHPFVYAADPGPPLHDTVPAHR